MAKQVANIDPASSYVKKGSKKYLKTIVRSIMKWLSVLRGVREGNPAQKRRDKIV
jgi:hypothetical protein